MSISDHSLDCECMTEDLQHNNTDQKQSFKNAGPPDSIVFTQISSFRKMF